MASLAESLKAEIARVARKELKKELLSLRKHSAAHRSQIASLRREVKELRAELKARAKVAKTPPAARIESAPASGRRSAPFTPEAFAAKRAKLGLTQAQMAQLLDCSALSISKWETGRASPRNAQLERIASIRGLGKREAAARLAAE